MEDNWSIMLGNEAKNYEITAVTLFRNEERERMFVKEVQGLAEGVRHATVDERAGDSSDLPLKRQVMGHFKEFSQKFSLLPPGENHGINLAVAWWGKAPAVCVADIFTRTPTDLIQRLNAVKPSVKLRHYLTRLLQVSHSCAQWLLVAAAALEG